MKNFIKKSEALDGLRMVKAQLPVETYPIVDACEAAIDTIPVSDLQPVTYGVWIDVTDEEMEAVGYHGAIRPSKCSLCGEWFVGTDEYTKFCNYCSSCGADMRGPSEE